MLNNQKISKKIYVFSLVVFLGLFLITTLGGLYYVYTIKRESATSIAKMTEGLIRSGRYREAINALSSAKLGSFEAIGYYNSNNQRVFILPPSIGPDYYEKNNSFYSDLLIYTLSFDVYYDEKEQDKAGYILFSYNQVDAIKELLFFYFLGVAFLVPVLGLFSRSIRKGMEVDLLEEKNRGIKETVKQVWHDINQPMQLLYVLVESGRGMDADVKEKVRSACDDMRSILDDLKGKKIEKEVKPSFICLSAFLKEVVENENLKYLKEKKKVLLKVKNDELGCFSPVNEIELKRIVSNLINNAIQASRENGVVEVILSSEKLDQNVIQIVDCGEGIKIDDLPHVGKRGVSFRKNGNGLGISYAIEKIKEWKGTFKIESEYLKGTTITIHLPKISSPDWFFTGTDLSNYKEIILLDDKPVIHTLMSDKLSGYSIKKYFFHNSDDFIEWYRGQKNVLEKPFFIFDYDLGEINIKGIDIIEKYSLVNNSVLMTNFFDDTELQKSADRANVKIFPKSLLEFL